MWVQVVVSGPCCGPCPSFYVIPRNWTQGPRLAWQVPVPEDPPQWPRCEALYGINVYYNGGMSALCDWLYSHWVRLKLSTLMRALLEHSNTLHTGKGTGSWGSTRNSGVMYTCQFGERIVSPPPFPSLLLTTVLSGWQGKPLVHERGQLYPGHFKLFSQDFRVGVKSRYRSVLLILRTTRGEGEAQGEIHSFQGRPYCTVRTALGGE